MAFDPEAIAERYDFRAVEEMAFLMPRGYNITARMSTIDEVQRLPDKTKVALKGRLVEFEAREGRGRIHFVRATLVDEQGRRQTCRWTSNRERLYGKLAALKEKLEGKVVQIHGTVSVWEKSERERYVFVQDPKAAEVPGTGRGDEVVPVPIYELKKKTKPHEVSRCIELALAETRPYDPPFPPEVERQYGLPSLDEALAHIHGKRAVPSGELQGFVSMDTPWHRRVKLERLWRTLVEIERDRHKSREGCEIPRIRPSRNAFLQLMGALPFELTDDQKRVIRGVLEGFAQGGHKRYLIQGDVGSGKTVVSLFLMLAASVSGYQSVIMCPSAILAKQHYEEFLEYSRKIGVPVFYYSGDMKKRERDRVRKAAREKPDAIFVGTLALNNLDYARLGLVVVDEEHKQGTAAKEALLNRGKLLPHQVLMSATPIPRTLASTFFANYEAMRIEAKPPGRKPVITELVETRERARRVFEFAERQFLERKRQTLVVVPSIGSEEMASVEIAAKICERYTPESGYLYIHGEMSGDEVEKAVEKFRAKEAGVLIATSMADSGISIPSIDLVVLLDPERWGLAGAHQVRGRAGRSDSQAYCALIPLNFDKPLSDASRERLEYFCRTFDGFALAEYDLKARGTGNLTGRLQHGGDLNLLEFAGEIEALRRHIPSTAA